MSTPTYGWIAKLDGECYGSYIELKDLTKAECRKLFSFQMLESFVEMGKTPPNTYKLIYREDGLSPFDEDGAEVKKVNINKKRFREILDKKRLRDALTQIA